MTAILVFILFVSFFMVDSFSNRQAAKEQLLAAFHAETAANRVQPMIVSPTAAEAAGRQQEAAELRFQVRAGNDRRRVERRGQRDQSAA
jgi:hypothetical protein